MRGAGPRVFVSYSYADQTAAQQVADHLADCGMQVRKEDESSLLGQPLEEVLPARIADCEVFVQLVTRTSAVSAWVRREFEWATRARAKRPVVLPLVFGDTVPPDQVSAWGYLPVRDPLDPSTLSVIRKTAMQAVATLQVNPLAPYELEQSPVRVVATGEPLSRRLLIDPENVILGAAEATVHYAAGTDAEYRDQMMAQQQRTVGRLAESIAKHDVFLPLFIDRARPLVQQHWSPEDALEHLVEIVQRLFRLTLGSELLKLTRDWRTAVSPALGDGASACAEAGEMADRLQATAPGIHERGFRLWALRSTTASTWLELGFDAPGSKDSTVALFPADRFSDSSKQLLRYGLATPQVEIGETDWLLYGLPQLAARIVWNTRTPDEIVASVEYAGWSLADYRNVGHH
ncbi:toll/interleukin-1 receptor domain-containing protein [Streptomyces sp. NBC_00663]|uniref:toll/interleukin-1 receptor domain-containing protein n=1 Tax=Streptomyces sp. NBC_00663 TaxID=2975801 RepID=UPI002E34F594|nr:toll/interleukin-1 receptor domain-containing protein [Streptomyces sp. NBC_00663]